MITEGMKIHGLVIGEFKKFVALEAQTVVLLRHRQFRRMDIVTVHARKNVPLKMAAIEKTRHRTLMTRGTNFMGLARRHIAQRIDKYPAAPARTHVQEARAVTGLAAHTLFEMTAEEKIRPVGREATFVTLQANVRAHRAAAALRTAKQHRANRNQRAGRRKGTGHGLCAPVTPKCRQRHAILPLLKRSPDHDARNLNTAIP